MTNFWNDMTHYRFSFYLFETIRMWSQNCFCSFCYVDSIFACFYLTGQLKLILQKFQLAGVVLVVSNPHIFNLTGQLESKPPEFPTLAAIDQPDNVSRYHMNLWCDPSQEAYKRFCTKPTECAFFPLFLQVCSHNHFFCESASRWCQKAKMRRIADSQHVFMEIWDTLIPSTQPRARSACSPFRLQCPTVSYPGICPIFT